MRRGRLALLLIPVGVMVVMTQVADALWPDLVSSAPELLIGLSSRNRYLVLVVNEIPAWSYYLIGTARLVAPDPFLFALGWFYGPAAIRWMERRTPTFGQIMRTVERYFARFGHALVVVFPNNYICVIAGAARMSPWLFGFLNVTGTVGRLVLIAVVGDVFQSPIDAVLDFVGRYRVPLLVISIGLVLLSVAGEARQGRTEIDALKELEREDADPVHAPEAQAAATLDAAVDVEVRAATDQVVRETEEADAAEEAEQADERAGPGTGDDGARGT